jgi:urate oxidase
MWLTNFTYGKGLVRVMRVNRESPRHEVRELSVQVMLEGEFAASFTSSDNSKVIATDSIKNIVNILARRYPSLENEVFVERIAAYFLETYTQVSAVTITTSETKWARLNVGGTPHDHAFARDANGAPSVELKATRQGTHLTSGICGYIFLKSTGSGWENYVMDEVTTLKPTDDRIFSTAMDASWSWSDTPNSYQVANAAILEAMLTVFATSYSPSVQNSLFLMGSAALAAVPEVLNISLACPNKHYIPLNLTAFGLDNPNIAFLPTDEPHGQIECTVARAPVA